MRTLEVDVVLDAGAALGECPGWWPQRSLLTWVDVHGARIHLFDPATGRDRHLELADPVGAVAVRARGGLVAAVGERVVAVDPDTGVASTLATLELDPPGRCNDAQCDPAGRLWIGTMTDAMVPGGASLRRLDPDGTVTRVLDEVTLANGMGWSPDGGTMYFVDSLAYTVDAFTVQPDGGLADRRTLVTVGDPAGGEVGPDGLAVDADGCVWVAVWGGGEIHRYTPAGVLDAVVRVPAPHVSSCAFGGPGLDVLYVTSGARPYGFDGPTDPAPAGALFACDPGIAGLPPRPFAG